MIKIKNRIRPYEITHYSIGEYLEAKTYNLTGLYYGIQVEYDSGNKTIL